MCTAARIAHPPVSVFLFTGSYRGLQRNRPERRVADGGGVGTAVRRVVAKFRQTLRHAPDRGRQRILLLLSPHASSSSSSSRCAAFEKGFCAQTCSQVMASYSHNRSFRVSPRAHQNKNVIGARTKEFLPPLDVQYTIQPSV